MICYCDCLITAVRQGIANPHLRRIDHHRIVAATSGAVALNYIRSAPGKDSLRVKRKAAGRDDDFLLAIIRGQNQ